MDKVSAVTYIYSGSHLDLLSQVHQIRCLVCKNVSHLLSCTLCQPYQPLIVALLYTRGAKGSQRLLWCLS